MKQLMLKAQKRELFGRKVKKLRKQGFLPANLYGKKIKSQALTVADNDFKTIYEQAGETNIVNLAIDKAKDLRPVLISNLQVDSVSDKPIHLDFHQVDLKEKVTVDIPVVIEGESPAVKEKGAVLIKLLDEIKVEALPTDLPNEFKLNIGNLQNFNDSLLVKDLPVDKDKISVLAAADEAIVMVQEPQKEELPEVEAEKPEVEAIAAAETEAGEEEAKVKEEAPEIKKTTKPAA